MILIPKILNMAIKFLFLENKNINVSTVCGCLVSVRSLNWLANFVHSNQITLDGVNNNVHIFQV